MSDPGSDPGEWNSPTRLPEVGDPRRWPWLLQLRRQTDLVLDPWLVAIEAGSLVPERDLLSILGERLDGASAQRLLLWWIGNPAAGHADQSFLELIGKVRDQRCRDVLRTCLLEHRVEDPADPRLPASLLPLLGYQRNPVDCALLCSWAVQPAPVHVRRAALEGLAVGLSSWPQDPLIDTLSRLASDLDRSMASTAIDLLARLPSGSRSLQALSRQHLDHLVLQRLDRRLARANRIGKESSGSRLEADTTDQPFG